MCIGTPQRKEQISRQMQLHKDGLNPCMSFKIPPKLGYNFGQTDKGFNYEEFTLYCPVCGYCSLPFGDLMGLISHWHTSNSADTDFRVNQWVQRHKELTEKEQAA